MATEQELKNISPSQKEFQSLLDADFKDRKVILAADDDREGEAIAWHCGDILKTDFNSNNRIIFREITKTAILKALKNPTKLNMNEVNAQKARSVIDLLIGYKLSPCLLKNSSSFSFTLF